MGLFGGGGFLGTGIGAGGGFLGAGSMTPLLGIGGALAGNALVPGLGGMLAGGLLGAQIGGGMDANSAAAAQAQNAMDYSTEMSDTSYQRGMADMKAAGLNPILAYSQGGASTPAGVAAPVVNPFANAASSAMQVSQTDADVKQTMAQTDGTQIANSFAPAIAQSQIDNNTASAAAAKAAAALSLSKVGESSTASELATSAATGVKMMTGAVADQIVPLVTGSTAKAVNRLQFDPRRDPNAPVFVPPGR